MVIAGGASQVAATWFGIHRGSATYRRIGPTDGPQVFCAGSSLLQFGIAWPDVSAAVGRGIENWGVGGSSPDIWEISQPLATNTDLMVVGISVYDLNEHHLADSRAHLVPLGRTVQDLWTAKVGWQFAKRVLSQYPLALLRTAFPTAGRSDAVLVGLRRKLLLLAGSSPTADDQANSLVLPSKPVLDFGDSTEKLSEWPEAKKLRRMAAQRNEIQGTHEFVGPKSVALLRMLAHAESRGRVIVVVMPVAPSYSRELLNPKVLGEFEAALVRAKAASPQAVVVRLDSSRPLQSDEYFSDFVHLNGAGRKIATQLFLEELKRHSFTQ